MYFGDTHPTTNENNFIEFFFSLSRKDDFVEFQYMLITSLLLHIKKMLK